MNKKELIKSLNVFDSEQVVVFDSSTGKYLEIKSIARGLGKGILLEIES